MSEALLALALPAFALLVLALLAAHAAHARERKVAALLFGLAGAWLGWRAIGPDFVAAPGGVVAACGALAFAALGAAPLLRSRRSGAPGAALALALATVAGAAVLPQLRVDASRAAEAAEPEARWAVRADPWHPGGWLALAWHARAAEEFPEAARALDNARRAGLAPAESARFRTELQAARGDCAGARSAWEAALEAQAAAIDPLEERLELGRLTLPPTFVLRCSLAP